jgi:hypothetical protein
MGNLEDDLRYMNQQLARAEQNASAARALAERYGEQKTLADVILQAELDAENFAYAIKRDRINRKLPP